MARLIDRMEQAGWVERRPDPKDRRAWLLFITEKVKPILTKMGEVGQVVRAEALAGLSADERTQILDMMLRVRRNLSDKGADAARPMAGAAE